MKKPAKKPSVKSMPMAKKPNVQPRSVPLADMPADDIDSDLLSMIKGKVAVPTDKLDTIRNFCKVMRMLTLDIEQSKLELAEKQKKLTKLSMVTLPELFNEHNIPTITLGAEGNLPAMTLERKPYYKAVLPRDDADNVRPEGLAWLETNKHGDLIKRVFTVKLPMDTKKKAIELRKLVKRLKLEYDEKQDVPWGTLTAFVREMIEKRGRPVPLDILGATVGHVVKIKQERGK